MPKKTSLSSLGPWRVHLNVPTAAIPGHLIKTDDHIGYPVAAIWQGGGTKGIPMAIANAYLIAAAPDLFDLVNEAIDADDYGPEDWEAWNQRAKSVIKQASLCFKCSDCDKRFATPEKTLIHKYKVHQSKGK